MIFVFHQLLALTVSLAFLLKVIFFLCFLFLKKVHGCILVVTFESANALVFDCKRNGAVQGPTSVGKCVSHHASDVSD